MHSSLLQRRGPAAAACAGRRRGGSGGGAAAAAAPATAHGAAAAAAARAPVRPALRARVRLLAVADGGWPGARRRGPPDRGATPLAAAPRTLRAPRAPDPTPFPATPGTAPAAEGSGAAAAAAAAAGPDAPAAGGGGDKQPAAAAAAAAAAGRVFDQPIVSPKKEAQLTAEEYRQIYDRLIGIFQSRPRDDWVRRGEAGRRLGWRRHACLVWARAPRPGLRRGAAGERRGGHQAPPLLRGRCCPPQTGCPPRPQKKLIVLSKQWPQHKSGVFDRVRERADREADVDAKMGLRRLFRTLQGVRGPRGAQGRVSVVAGESLRGGGSRGGGEHKRLLRPVNRWSPPG
jgi:hypothetical protein